MSLGHSLRGLIRSLARQVPRISVFGAVMVVGAVVAALGAPRWGFAQNAAHVAAKPLDAATAILDAFKTHDVVALGDSHGNLPLAAFIESLVRDPRFAETVNDVVVEFGNGRHQALMDRYISGEAIPEREVRVAWLETTQPHTVWDRDIFSDFFRSVRELNAGRPREKQVRVLLGDTPYPAASGTLRSDAFPVQLVRDEVLSKKRKALIIYGAMHYLRRNAAPPPGSGPTPASPSIVSGLEQSGAKVFSIWPHVVSGARDLAALQPDIASWPRPSLTLIKGNILGRAPFGVYYPSGSGRIVRSGAVFDLTELIGGTMEEQVDAVLYLGPPTNMPQAPLSAELCRDPEYVAMREKRLAALQPPPPPPGGSTSAAMVSPAAAFRQQCAAVVTGE